MLAGGIVEMPIFSGFLPDPVSASAAVSTETFCFYKSP